MADLKLWLTTILDTSLIDLRELIYILLIFLFLVNLKLRSVALYKFIKIA